MIWIVLAIIVVLLAFCLWGLTLSLKRSKHDKKLRESSDYTFKTEKGNYSFVYMVKGFKKDEGKLIKIAMHPFLGFADLATAQTNSFTSINIVCKDKKTNTEITTTEAKVTPNNALQVSSEIIVPADLLDEQGNANVEITVDSWWYLGGTPIDEQLMFDFNK